MSIKPRNELLSLSEAVHGSIDESELERLGLEPKSILDFSSNVNPFAPSPEVQTLIALGKTPLNAYPDRESIQLRRAIATKLDVSLDRLMVGNGSSELLWLIAFAYLEPRDNVLIVGPTYSEYRRSALLMGARVVTCDAKPETGFEVPVQDIENALRNGPRILYVCNPNNPTGQLLDPTTIRRWAGEYRQTLFVVDEAYIEFASGENTFAAKAFANDRCRNVIVLRSMTKAYGLAGLRLGYAIADPDVIQVLCSVRPPWSVNTVAQLAGILAIQDESHHQQALTQLLNAKRALMARLKSAGLHPLPSATAFFLLPVRDAAQTRATLLKSKILVRDCTSFGLPGFIRIAVRPPADNDRLVDALASCKIYLGSHFA